MSMELLKKMIEEKLSELRRVEQKTQALLAEINNMSVGLPVDITQRYSVLAERMRMFAKRLDDLSSDAKTLSSELRQLKIIEMQMS